MSYSIHIGGHGVPKEDVERVFKTAVRELRKATGEPGSQEGWADPSMPTGTASGGGPDGTVSIRAEDVEDE